MRRLFCIFSILIGGIFLHIVIYVVSNVVSYFLTALELLMFLRAIMSWFFADESNKLYSFAISVTEPIIAPIRYLLEKFDFIRGLPIDISFIVTFILLNVIQNLLP